MPFDRRRYPPDWKQISHDIRFVRAGGKCEVCGAVHKQPHPITGSIVILTTAHLGAPKDDGSPGDPHDKLDVRPQNLKAMCQRCHLLYDMNEHVLNRAKTRRQKQIDAGQIELDL